MYIICIYLLIWLYMYKSMSSNWDFDGFHMISWDVQSTLAWSCEGIYPQGILVAGFQALTPAITFSIQASKNHKSRVCWGILHVGGEGLCIYKLYINYIYIHYYVSIYYIIYIHSKSLCHFRFLQSGPLSWPIMAKQGQSWPRVLVIQPQHTKRNSTRWQKTG